MQTTIQHQTGLTFSIKTFRPLWIFPWTSSVWRQFPLATCIATVSYDGKQAAEVGHKRLVALLDGLKIGPDMSEAFDAIDKFCKGEAGAGVRSYRVYPGHAVEGKVAVQITPARHE